jgi:polyhydroxyalkanoate synthase
LADRFSLPLLLGGIAVVGALLLAGSWLFATTKADQRLLRPGLVARRWRTYKWFWFRIGLNLFSWPHVVDVALRTHKARVEPTSNEVIWRKGRAELRRYGNAPRGNEAVLVVHSLVSKPWILDLAPGRSLVEFLVSEEFDVFLLDWGDPTADDVERGLSACSNVLMEAEEHVLRSGGFDKLHLLGYCLGGLLCLLRAGARRHDNLASITVLATPVDFSVRVGLQPLVSHRFFKPGYFLDASGCVPADALRESFHILRPNAIRTVLGAWRRRKDAAFRHVYDPLARWVWEHRALTGQALFDLVELFRTNAFLKGDFTVSGELARLQDIRAPVLSVVADRDHIVPSESSHALGRVEGLDVRIAALDSGHVSMVSGSTATSTTWPTIAGWIREQS